MTTQEEEPRLRVEGLNVKEVLGCRISENSSTEGRTPITCIFCYFAVYCCISIQIKLPHIKEHLSGRLSPNPRQDPATYCLTYSWTAAEAEAAPPAPPPAETHAKINEPADKTFPPADSRAHVTQRTLLLCVHNHHTH